MRLLFGFALVLLLSASVAHTPDSETVIHFERIALDRDQPDRRDFDQLELLGAWRLTSNNSFFGGISSMRVGKGRFLALSDASYVFRFDFDGRQAQAPLRVRPLPGIYTTRYPDRDAESMTTDPDTGMMWVGFEASNSIRRFSPNLGAKRAWVAPTAMTRWPDNQGAEGMVRLPDGRFLVFSEAAPGPDDSAEALIFPGDPTLHGKQSTRFFYKPPLGYSTTDASLLPDGRVLISNRRFTVLEGVAAKLTIIDPKEIVPDRIVPSKLVASLKPPLRIDNMEALSVEQRHGRTIIWLASDDNFNPLQQTLLMKFALKDTSDAH
jgi:hypothetical protein